MENQGISRFELTQQLFSRHLRSLPRLSQKCAVFKTLVDDELGEYTTLHILGMMRIQERGIPTSQYNTGWWFGTCFFFHILGIVIPTDFHIFQRGRSTTNRNAVHDAGILERFVHQEC